MEAATDDGLWMQLIVIDSESPKGTPWRRQPMNDMRIMDQLEELRGCDKRLTACMLDRLGDLRR